jgi:protein involved in ribonucleotide reduction
MKRNLRLFETAAALKCLLATALVFAICSVSYAQKPKKTGVQKPSVLVLATYHMDNPGLDLMNVQSDDVLTEKRQKEIRELVSLLKRFKPTKIAVEAPFGSVKVDEQYNRYLRGEYQLTRNEIDQIGYRMAKELNHQKIYGVDAEGKFDIGRVFAFAGANNQQDIVGRGMAIGKRQITEENKLIQTATITQIYKVINDQRRINEAHQAYLMMSRIGKDKEYPGASLLADWYERNLKIFSNIQRISELNNDRILVIIGGNHVKQLQQFIEDSGEYNLERTGRYF